MPGEATLEMLAQAQFYAKLQVTTDTAFEELFHELMSQTGQGGYLAVRSRGDKGADGLGIWDGKLYACYGSTTADPSIAIRKFRDDLRSACDNRSGEFAEFVFVHNDTGDAHPDLSRAIAQAKRDYPNLKITPWGRRELRNLFLDLQPRQWRRILGSDLEVSALVPRVGMEEVAHLLEDLTGRVQLAPADLMSEIPLPKADKLDFNGITGGNRDLLVLVWKHTGLAEEYFRGHRDPMAEPQAVEALRTRYVDLRDDGADAEETISELLVYVGGAALSGDRFLAAYTVLAYFLQCCHIFENPPDVGAGVETGPHAAA